MRYSQYCVVAMLEQSETSIGHYFGISKKEMTKRWRTDMVYNGMNMRIAGF